MSDVDPSWYLGAQRALPFCLTQYAYSARPCSPAPSWSAQNEPMVSLLRDHETVSASIRVFEQFKSTIGRFILPLNEPCCGADKSPRRTICEKASRIE